MKRTEIKRRPLSDTVLANFEADIKEYRELDGNNQLCATKLMVIYFLKID